MEIKRAIVETLYGRDSNFGACSTIVYGIYSASKIDLISEHGDAHLVKRRLPRQNLLENSVFASIIWLVCQLFLFTKENNNIILDLSLNSSWSILCKFCSTLRVSILSAKFIFYLSLISKWMIAHIPPFLCNIDFLVIYWAFGTGVPDEVRSKYSKKNSCPTNLYTTNLSNFL